jgi:hypothetical protein
MVENVDTAISDHKQQKANFRPQAAKSQFQTTSSKKPI